MKRRKVLKAVPGIITGAGLSTVVSGKQDPEQVVQLVPEPHNLSQSVEPETPVTHRLAWKTVGNEGPDVLREALEVTSYQAYFDDEPLVHGTQHWGPIHLENEASVRDRWVVEWEFRLPAVASGTHEFKVTVDYDQPFTSKMREDYEITRTETDILTAQYTV